MSNNNDKPQFDGDFLRNINPEKWEDRSDKIDETWPNQGIEKMFVSRTASVLISTFGDKKLLSIQNHPETPMDWFELQQIKNEICGEGALAVFAFPPQTRPAKQANRYHLLVF